MMPAMQFCRRATAALVLAVVLVLAGCSDEQDPGLVPGPSDPTAETSDTLGRCPAGGPDATTPSAGCLADDGTVQHP